MATGKCIADLIHDRGPHGLVTAIAANGRHIGVRVSGQGNTWYVADAPIDDVQLLEGFQLSEVCPATGDSSVVETIGLGAFALTAAPSLAHGMGMNRSAATSLVADMRKICLTESPRYRLPSEDFRGTPFGISVEAILASEITPAFTGGYAHRELDAAASERA